MEKRERRNSFGWNLLAVLLLFFVISWVSSLIQFLVKGFYRFTIEQGMGLFFASYILVGFLSALIMEDEKIVGIIRQRKGLVIRKEWIFLSTAALVLAGMKFWFPKLLAAILGEKVFPPIFFYSLTRDFFGDIIFGFAAALFLVGIFQIVSGDVTEKKGKVGLVIWNIFAMLCVLLMVYFIYKFEYFLRDQYDNFGRYEFSYRWGALPRYYYLILAQIVSAFICALLFQGEQVVKILRGRRRIVFRWELLLLSVMALFLAHMHFWLPVLLRELGLLSGASDLSAGVLFMTYLLRANFSNVVFAFAAGVLLVRVFYVKEEKVE